MIEANYPFGAFAGAPPDGGALAAQIASSLRLPAVAMVNTIASSATIVFDTNTSLTAPQQSALDALVRAHDGPADLLATTKAALELDVDEHARTLRQSAGKTPGEVDATRDTTRAAVAAAPTIDDAIAITEAYTGREIPK